MDRLRCSRCQLDPEGLSDFQPKSRYTRVKRLEVHFWLHADPSKWEDLA